MIQNGVQIQMNNVSNLRVGILGLGTVGLSVIRLIQQNSVLYAARTGRIIDIVGVSARSKNRARSVDISAYKWFSNPLDMVDEVDVIIEVAGGFEPAEALAKATLAAGKNWITANKALLAERGAGLIKLAETYNAHIGFEAAVCTAIPVIKVLGHGMAANRISSVQGIFNGTCNYIAAQMSEGMSFDDALADATAQGYAEADPTLDIGGGDAAHKTALMAALVFGGLIDFDQMHVEGVDQLPEGISHRLAQNGYSLKLLGQCRPQAKGNFAVWVYPAAIPSSHALAGINGVTNAVAYHGDCAGHGMLQGVGAGGDATASAILADLLDAASGRGSIAGGLSSIKLSVAPIAERMGNYYVAGIDSSADWGDIDIQIMANDCVIRSIVEHDLTQLLKTMKHDYWIRIEGEQ